MNYRAKVQVIRVDLSDLEPEEGTPQPKIIIF